LREIITVWGSHRGSLPVVKLGRFDKLGREEASKRFLSERVHVLYDTTSHSPPVDEDNDRKCVFKRLVANPLKEGFVDWRDRVGVDSEADNHELEDEK